jgi:nitroimidazol reductase NimA-like FMN-containing flavoprotein (pyridoxamine 5'-phosphate oxidase superfamily)
MRATQIGIIPQFRSLFISCKTNPWGICAVDQEPDRKIVDDDKRQDLEVLLNELFATQRYAVLATQNDGQPYTNLVAFAVTEDLRSLLFATPRATRKFANLTNDPQVAMMIDNRENKAADLRDAVAVAAMGTAEEVVDPEKEVLLELYVSKHPHLEAFARAPSCALLKISVERYDIAREFQNVVELRMTP